MSATLAINRSTLAPTTEAVTITTQYWEMIPANLYSTHTRRQENLKPVFGQKLELLHFVRLDDFEYQCQDTQQVKQAKNIAK